MFSNLETEAKQMPATIPLSNAADILNRFILEGHVDLTMQKTYSKAIEGANWVVEKDDKGQTPVNLFKFSNLSLRTWPLICLNFCEDSAVAGLRGLRKSSFHIRFQVLKRILNGNSK